MCNHPSRDLTVPGKSSLLCVLLCVSIFALASIFQLMGLIPGSSLIFKANKDNFFIWATDLSFSSTFPSYLAFLDLRRYIGPRQSPLKSEWEFFPIVLVGLQGKSYQLSEFLIECMYQSALKRNGKKAIEITSDICNGHIKNFPWIYFHGDFKIHFEFPSIP